MRVRMCGAGFALALSAVIGMAARPAPAAVVADYQDDFRTTGGPAPGWSYLWNANGPLGNPANYVPLPLVGEQYAGPGGAPVAGRSPADPVAYPPMAPFPSEFPQTFVRPGPGSLQDAGGVERAIVLAYTFTPEDFAAAGAVGQGLGYITAYDFAVSTLSSPDGMSARVYHNNDPTPLIEFSDDTVPPFPFPPGFRFETTLDPRPIPIGMYAPGETVFIAIGGNTVATGDEMRLDLTFSLEPVPEPAALSILAPAGLLLLRRRK